MIRISEHDVVRLIGPAPGLGLPIGSKGSVVLTYPESNPEVVEVEFVDTDGETTKLATVAARLLEVVWSERSDS